MNGRPPPVSPSHFCKRMEKQWHELGNASSDALRECWMLLAANYGRMIMDIETGRWIILPLPTGTGKTVGTALYCSMVAEQNKSAEHPVGVLIINRLKSQCDDMVRDINKHSPGAAVVHHSDSSLHLFEKSHAQILVITHAAYVQALANDTHGDAGKLTSYTHWDHGRRNLVIIDEALDGLIQHHEVRLSLLDSVLAALPDRIIKAHRQEVDALKHLSDVLVKCRTESLSGTTSKSCILWDGQSHKPSIPPAVDLSSLLRSLRGEDLSRGLVEQGDHWINQHLREKVPDLIRAAQAILDGYCLYARKGDEHVLHTSRCLLTGDVPPAVVLDATAELNPLWALLDHKVHVVPLPASPRRYGNVTLHVARGRGIGKNTMIKKADQRIPRLMDESDKQLDATRKPLLIVHKAIEDGVRIYMTTTPMQVTHWGSIDGKNCWQECDSVVVYGLPFVSNTLLAKIFFATQGVQDNAWFSRPSWSGHDDVLSMIQDGQISASIIQAINRVRCRKAIDADGNCEPVDVYIVLPRGDRGDRLLLNIVAAMPGMREVPWSFQLDGDQVRVKQGSWHDALVCYVEGQSGIVCLADFQKLRKVPTTAMKELRKCLNNHAHVLAVRLRQLGYVLETHGKTKGAKHLLVPL